MTWKYGQLVVESAVALPSLYSTNTSADVQILLDEAPIRPTQSSWELTSHDDTTLVLSALVGSVLVMDFDYGGVVRVELDLDRGEIRLHNPAGIAETTLEHIITNQALPQYASLTGQVILHGSAVSVGGRAIVMFGPSGAGKSTTASHLVAAGAELITDDSVVLQVDVENGGVVVHAVSRFVRLFDDSREQVFRVSPPTTMVGTHTEKRHIRLSDDQLTGNAELPVCAAIALGTGPVHPLRRLRETSRLAVLDESLLGLIGNSREARTLRFERLLELAGVLPMWEIGMSFTPRGTEEAVEQILALA